MKKRMKKYILLAILLMLAVVAGVNVYRWIIYGEQEINISIPNKAEANSDLYVSIIAQEDGIGLETESKVKLLNSDGKKVKDVKVSYDGSNSIIGIPDVESGQYIVEARVSSEAGTDVIQKHVYVTKGKRENITVTLDKGIYKPRR